MILTTNLEPLGSILPGAGKGPPAARVILVENLGTIVPKQGTAGGAGDTLPQRPPQAPGTPRNGATLMPWVFLWAIPYRPVLLFGGVIGCPVWEPITVPMAGAF